MRREQLEHAIRAACQITAAVGGHPSFTGWCLDKEDLCVAKLCAHREKDLNFVDALLDHQLVDAAVIAERLDRLDAGRERAAAQARVWMRARSGPDR